MQKPNTTRAVAAAVITGGFAVAITLIVALKPGPGHVTAFAPPAQSNTIRLTGVVRDFRRTHPDFGIIPSAGYGHYAGCASQNLTSESRPAFVGQITDTTTITNFQITQGNVTPGEPFAAMVTLLGAAIENSSYHTPVTMTMHMGSSEFETFGPFANAVLGNINDNQSVTGNANPGSNPRRMVFPTIFPPHTPIAITGRSWNKTSEGALGTNPANWQPSMTANSHDESAQVMVLRNGSPVPNIPGFNNQTSIATYVRDFVDSGSNTIRLLDNQAIYLFEVGTTNLTSAAADFQDLVVLVTLARDPAYLNTLDVFGHETAASHQAGSGYRVNSEWRDRAGRPIAPHLYRSSGQNVCGVAFNDSPGSRGAVSTGGIQSSATFDQWFRDDLGQNLSDFHTLTLTRDSDGVYTYSTNEFHPIDGRLLGNEGDAHNFYLTLAITTSFVYRRCENQFFEFSGADDCWVYVNGQLVMDRGGVLPATSQHIDMDRLDLVDGQTCELRMFHAQRQTQQADFHLRTNIFLQGQATPTVTGGYD
jgi:fibro-slime domain-containing protein